MEEKTVEISVAEYHKLLKVAERVECLRRMVAASEYVSTGEIMAVLDIHEPTRGRAVSKNEAV